jgi:hypothetical protein
MMQQYGFVQRGGNLADRIEFPELPAGQSISLPHLEALLGDSIFVQMMEGEHPYLTAVIRSVLYIWHFQACQLGGRLFDNFLSLIRGKQCHLTAAIRSLHVRVRKQLLAG